MQPHSRCCSASIVLFSLWEFFASVPGLRRKAPFTASPKPLSLRGIEDGKRRGIVGKRQARANFLACCQEDRQEMRVRSLRRALMRLGDGSVDFDTCKG